MAQGELRAYRRPERPNAIGAQRVTMHTRKLTEQAVGKVLRGTYDDLGARIRIIDSHCERIGVDCTAFVIQFLPQMQAKARIQLRSDDNISRLQDFLTLWKQIELSWRCLLYTSPSPRDRTRSRMPSSA